MGRKVLRSTVTRTTVTSARGIPTRRRANGPCFLLAATSDPERSLLMAPILQRVAQEGHGPEKRREIPYNRPAGQAFHCGLERRHVSEGVAKSPRPRAWARERPHLDQKSRSDLIIGSVVCGDPLEPALEAHALRPVHGRQIEDEVRRTTTADSRVTRSSSAGHSAVMQRGSCRAHRLRGRGRRQRRACSRR